MFVSREQPNFAGRLHPDSAIAIELEFVRPSYTFGQFGNCQGEHRLDESDLGFRDTHDTSVATRTGVEQTIAVIGWPRGRW